MWTFEQMQSDTRIRVVHPNNLRAMCARVSGTCRTWQVRQISKRFAYVEYSNPNVYGTPNPMTALLPVLPSGEIVLSIHDVRNDYRDQEGWQNFQCLIDCPTLWRSAPDKDDWHTAAEIEHDKRVAAGTERRVRRDIRHCVDERRVV